MTRVTTTTEASRARAGRAQSQFQVAMLQFRRNRLAMTGLVITLLLYLMAIFAPFLAPDGLSVYSTTNITRFAPPTPVQWRDPDTGAFTRPFVYGYTQQLNLETFTNEYTEDRSQRYPIQFFVRGDEYRILGLIPGNLHLYGVQDPGRFYLVGADNLGRDMFSRIMYAAQISLTIGLAAVFISTVIGVVMGATAAYFGGWVDNVIMRLVEVLFSIPSLFLLIMLRAIFPIDINPIFALYVIIGILAFIGWGGLARTTRSMMLSTRELDYVSAARSLGASNGRIMFRHMVPAVFTYLIVDVSLAIPAMMLTEAGLSFLGIGAVEPYASWGSLLNQAQAGGFSTISERPWLLIPGWFIVLGVAAYQLMGDGLRDALDPRKRR